MNRKKKPLRRRKPRKSTVEKPKKSIFESTRRPTKTFTVHLTEIAYQQIKASAAETYKQEADGMLLGFEAKDSILVMAAWTVTRADKRSYWRVETPTAHSIAEPFLSEWRVGGWHSHPDATVHMSEDDKRDSWDVEVVCAVERGPRKWRFKMGAYWEPEPGVWRKAELRVPEVKI